MCVSLHHPPLQAHPRRVAKVAKQIEREVGSLLITDKVCAGAGGWEGACLLVWKRSCKRLCKCTAAWRSRWDVCLLQCWMGRGCSCVRRSGNNAPQARSRQEPVLASVACRAHWHRGRPPCAALAPPPQVMQAAVCPERARGFDGALSALASVTEVQISNDLQVAKVYISLYRWVGGVCVCACGCVGVCWGWGGASARAGCRSSAGRCSGALGGGAAGVGQVQGALGGGARGAAAAVEGCPRRCCCPTLQLLPHQHQTTLPVLRRSDDLGKAAAMEGLQRLEPYVRKHVGRAVRLRLTPEIRFVRDDSIERSERIFKLLDQVGGWVGGWVGG